MPELEVREWIAYGLIAAMLLSAGTAGVIIQRRMRWRKLRLSGDGEVKRRDMQRR